jgi:phosphatidylserine/phosphatidylglycerophosphate/cardiolipin synthase-like enzyme
MTTRFNFRILPLMAAITIVSACQSPVYRVPASQDLVGWEDLRELHLERAELESLIVHYTGKDKKKKVSEYMDQKKIVDKKIRSIENQLQTIQEINQVFTHKKENWRVEEDAIELNEASFYEYSKKAIFQISTYEAKYTQVTLTHNLFSNAGYVHTNGPRHQKQKPKLSVWVTCDAPIKFDYVLGDKTIAAKETYQFSLGDHKLENSKSVFTLDSKFNTCDFVFTSSRDKKKDKTMYGFQLINETKKMKFMDHLLSTTQICALKKDSDSFFETSEFSNMTCPVKYDSIKVLPEPEDSLEARVQTLLGRSLPKDFVKNGNPYAKLDFSKAPKYDAIFLSYLVFRADFYGTLLARLLTYHADQGTFVRIITSKITSLDKDFVLFEKTMAKHPNVKFVLYRFDKDQKGGASFSEFHRTNHVKLFVAYSKTNEKDSMVIVGGKNIHDGFVFKKPADVSAYPEIVNYVTGDESWAYWRDFEMVVRGQDFVESVVRHFMNFYHINKENFVMKRPSISFTKADAPESPKETMRHYVSVPFKDQTNLNQFYAKFLDSAKKKILISSPYFRPVKEIADALERAVNRGVDITIITRLDLEGDTADFIIGAVNKDGVNAYFKKIKVFEYTEPKVILHSKLLMIDDEVSFISSVNLNKRSFYHDLENGVMVNDPEFTVEMSELYKEYMKLSTQITGEQKFELWKKWLITIFDKVM